MPVLKSDIKKALNKTRVFKWLNYEKYEYDIQYITALLSYLKLSASKCVNMSVTTNITELFSAKVICQKVEL